MKSLLTSCGFLLGLLLACSTLYASHQLGAEITYKHLGGSVYRVRHSLYIDCAAAWSIPLPGAGAPPAPVLEVTPLSGCGPATALGAPVMVQYTEITQICPTASTRCTNPSASVAGVAQAIFDQDWDFAGAAAGCVYRISWSDCCRSSILMSGAVGEGMYVFADLMILPGQENSSPFFYAPPVVYAAAGQQQSFAQAAYDPDGDSLVYSLVACLQDSALNVSYNPGYSPAAPLGSYWSVTVHPQTGVLTCAPALVGPQTNAVMALQVEEYRHGQKIGSVRRDCQVSVLPFTGSSLMPVASGAMQMTGGFFRDPVTIAVLPGQPLAFEVTASVTSLSSQTLLAQLPSVNAAFGATVVAQTTSGTTATVHFSHTFSLADTGQYTLGLPFLDNTCPMNRFGGAGVVIRVDTTRYLSVSGAATPALCGDSVGSIDFTVSGGYLPFHFQWSNGDTTEDLSHLPPGTYTVTLTDAIGQTASDTVVVGGVKPKVLLEAHWPSCTAGATLTALAYQGIPPFTYLWNTQDTVPVLTHMSPAGYQVYVWDAAGCVAEAVAVISKPAYCDVEIQGTVYADSNENCIRDPGEAGISGVWVTATPGYGVLTDTAGHYTLFSSVGAVVLRVMGQQLAPAACAPQGDSLTRYFPFVMTSLSGNDFPMVPAPPSPPDYAIVVASLGAAPGMTSPVYIAVFDSANFSNPVLPAADITYQYDSIFQFVQAIPPPTGHDALSRTVWWHHDSLAAMLTLPGVIEVTLETAAGTALGTVYWDSVSMVVFPPDAVLSNNHMSAWGIVTGSFDPNQKAVVPRGKTAEGYVPATDSLLTYTIHFQNTGTDTAFYVTLQDTLAASLSPGGFRALGSSFPYTLTLEEGHILVFRFDHINLPDSGRDEPGSHGFVTFQLPFHSPVQGTLADNRAAIYFDFNAPVITNTVRNTRCDPVEATVSAIRGKDGKWVLTADAPHALTLEWDLGQGGTWQGNAPEPFVIADTGHYPIRLIAANPCSRDTVTLLLHETWSVGDDPDHPITMDIFPNPVVEGSRILVSDPQVHEATLLDAAGRTVRILPVLHGVASFVRGDLPAGVYYVRVRADDGRTSGKKVVLEQVDSVR